MKNKSVQNCRFVHHAKLHCIVTTLNILFKTEFERGENAGKCVILKKYEEQICSELSICSPRQIALHCDNVK